MITEEQAKKAAKWWRTQLEAKTKGSIGETGIVSMFVNSRTMNNGGDFNRFEEVLTQKILAYDDDYLNVDYGPCPVLREAATEAGLQLDEPYPWPLKTIMWLMDGKVKVRAGYGAPIQEI